MKVKLHVNETNPSNKPAVSTKEAVDSVSLISIRQTTRQENKGFLSKST